MGTRLLYGIMQGYRKSQQNYENIHNARAKKKQADELYDIESKAAKLDLEAKVRTGQMEQIIADQVLSQLKDKDSAHKATSKVETNMQNQALYKEKGEMENAKRNFRNTAMSIMKQSKAAYTTQKGFHLKEVTDEDRKVPAHRKALGVLRSGQQRIGMMGALNEFKTRKEAEKYASNKLGYDWEQRFPEAVGILDKNWGIWGIKIPKNLNKASQIAEYLMSEKNMTKEQAIEYLRQNQGK